MNAHRIWIPVLLIAASAVRAEQFDWLNVKVFPDDLETTGDAWTAARVEDQDFISYRCAADDFVLTERTHLTTIGFYSVEFDADILAGDWYIYEVGSDGHPGALLAGANTVPLLHEDSGIVNTSFGTVYRNTMDADVTLDPGSYFAAFRSLITFKNGGGKHSLLTTRVAIEQQRANWSFDVFADGSVGGPWVTMDVFNLEPNNEWAFFLSGETEGGPCDGSEKLKATCATKNCGRRVKAVLKNAVPGAQAIFYIDGGDPVTTLVKPSGKAVVKWCPVVSDGHTVTVQGCDGLEAITDCL